MTPLKKAVLIVLDSVGVGALPDARLYGDESSNTLGHCALAAGGIKLPHLGALGLGCITRVLGVPCAPAPLACYGKMAERSPGKDTTTGHWELTGVILQRPFPVYPDGFPAVLLDTFRQQIGRDTLGNKAASGTVIIEELGPEHMQTGSPIVYTSADSVFQIAAHEEIIPLAELYRICGIARELLQGEHAVGRVIARPFTGEPGSFKRTANRHDYSLPPTAPTVLETLQGHGLDVVAVGKINDIFTGVGITRTVKSTSNDQGIEQTLSLLREDFSGLIFTNLVDFDQEYGHRNDALGYAKALERFDSRLPEILGALGADDLLIITADHGTDPTTRGTDHSREYVPLLVYGHRCQKGLDLGKRASFSDVAASVAEFFGLSFPVGQSFFPQVKP